MKVLFVSSGNNYLGTTPVVKRQAESLSAKGVEIIHFSVKGKGSFGYLSNLSGLRSFIKKESPDIVHAHYSLSAYLSILAGAKPLVISLMGSDVRPGFKSSYLLKIFYFFFRPKIIVKSEKMYDHLGIKNAIILPNGVDIDHFIPRDKAECRQKLGWGSLKIHILFVANPARKEKNFILAEQAFQKIGLQDIEMHSLTDVVHEHVPIWMNAADVVILTSLNEGSPNVIKEAMACNKPVVSTNVGDVEWLLRDVPGTYITSFDPEDVSENLRKAIEFSMSGNPSEGRQRILNYKLDSLSVAEKIISLYNTLLGKNE